MQPGTNSHARDASDQADRDNDLREQWRWEKNASLASLDCTFGFGKQTFNGLLFGVGLGRGCQPKYLF